MSFHQLFCVEHDYVLHLSCLSGNCDLNCRTGSGGAQLRMFRNTYKTNASDGESQI